MGMLMISERSQRVLVVLVTAAVIFCSFWYYTRDKTPTAETIPPVATNTVSPTETGGVVTQSDGSVIVRDKGASFTMAPITSSQPPVVTEQAVRSRSKPQ